MDTIASCAFGVNAESFSNKTSNFVAFANKIFESRPIDGLKILMTIIPGGYKLLKTLNISLNKKFETEFFYQVIIASLNNRLIMLNKRLKPEDPGPDKGDHRNGDKNKQNPSLVLNP